MKTYSEIQKLIEGKYPASKILFNEPMANHTSFKIGGTVPLLVIPDSEEALIDINNIFITDGIKPFVFGNGTNLLVSDSPLSFPAIKLHGGLNKIRRVSDTEIVALSGVSLSKLATFARDEGLSGLEFAHGIPGTLGGAIYMNAGAYGGEMSQIITKVRSTQRDYWVNECDFSYRHSTFIGKDEIILSSTIKLNCSNIKDITDKMNELAQRRKSSQPLDMPSAGSTFKRPVGGYAAALIEKSGLKGFSIGGAMVSEKHAGFVVNSGGATFENVLELIQYIQDTVFNKFGIALEPEVLIIK